MRSPSAVAAGGDGESLAGHFAGTEAEHESPKALLQTLRVGLYGIARQADLHDRDAAASELTTVYMNDFEPIERYLMGRDPQAIRPLEIKWNALRGELYAGLEGHELAARLDRLFAEVEAVVGRHESQPAGAFGPAFVASLVTIVREGVEVILILTMLLALVSKTALARPGGVGETPPGNPRAHSAHRRPIETTCAPAGRSGGALRRRRRPVSRPHWP